MSPRLTCPATATEEAAYLNGIRNWRALRPIAPLKAVAAQPPKRIRSGTLNPTMSATVGKARRAE